MNSNWNPKRDVGNHKPEKDGLCYCDDCVFTRRKEVVEDKEKFKNFIKRIPFLLRRLKK
jgi:nuclear transport factor 2 (NTF2) superfamily protein